MITSLILFLAVSSVSPDRVDMAIESYRGVESYKVTLRSRSADSTEIINYYYKKPGFVRMVNFAYNPLYLIIYLYYTYRL